MDTFLDKLRALRARLRFFLFRDRFDREMAEEMRFHLDLRAAEHERSGASPNEARDAARRRFGNQTALQEQRRAAAGSMTLETLGQDLRYVLRALRHSPGFSAMVVVTLGLGIGANAAMFGIIDRLLLRGPAHIVDADRVARLYATQANGDIGPFTYSVVGFVSYIRLRENVRTFDDLAVYSRTEATVGHGEDARRVKLGRVSWTFFPVLGVKPVVGRFFDASEDRVPRGDDVIVLDEGYWRRAYGGDRAAIGRTLVIGGVPYTIVGVAPQGFTGVELEQRDGWVPISLPHWGPGGNWSTAWDNNWLQIVGRLKPGVSAEEASADLTSAHRRSYDGPADNTIRDATFSVAPLRYDTRGKETTETRVSRWLLAVAVIVLLIACANVANLFVARAARRRREVAVRLALGVGRGRLVRLLLAESTVLALAGGGLGVALAFGGGNFVRGVLLPNVAWTDAAVDVRVLAVTAVAAILTGLLVGLVPALQGTRVALVSALKTGTRDGGSGRSRLRTVLTVTQAALSVVLLVGTGLFVQSLWRVNRLELGLEPNRVVMLSFDWPSVPGQSQEDRAVSRVRQNSFYETALARVRALPGVERAAVVIGTPFRSSNSTALRVPGIDSIPKLAGGGPYIRSVSDDYFATAGTRVLRGREFSAADVSSGAPVAIVNETMARALWKDRDPIGQCLLIDTLPCSSVIGVVEDARRFQLREDPAMQYYIPLGRERLLGFGGRRLFIRPAGDAAALGAGVRREILRLDPTIGYVTVEMMQDALDPQIRPWRLGATMFGVFGALALVVAAIGLYSVIAYLVAQRRHELGVRIALGAQVGDVAALVIRYGVGLAAVGTVIGSVLALNGARWIEPILFETSPRDPKVFAVVVGVLLIVALLASLVPAWRASRVDPIDALRSD